MAPSKDEPSMEAIREALAIPCAEMQLLFFHIGRTYQDFACERLAAAATRFIIENI